MSKIKIGDTVYDNVKTVRCRDADDESKYVAFTRFPDKIDGAMNVTIRAFPATVVLAAAVIPSYQMTVTIQEKGE